MPAIDCSVRTRRGMNSPSPQRGAHLVIRHREAHPYNMGMLSRALVPRSVRRATHPVRTVKRAVTPKPIKQVQRALNPVSNLKYGIERSLTSAPRTRNSAPSHTHAGCSVQHRTAEASAKCRTGRSTQTGARSAAPQKPKPHRSEPRNTEPQHLRPSVASSRVVDSNVPLPAAPKPSWRRHVPQLTGAMGGSRVTLTYHALDGALMTATVEILSVDGWTCLARNHALHRVDEYDLRKITRIV